MAFRVPTFNLFCNLWDGNTFPGGGPRAFSVPCQLRHPEHVNAGQVNILAGETYPTMLLLVPAHTDIRDPWSGVGLSDRVEVVPGSNRFYQVVYVDDVAKGFPNEYRVAYLSKFRTMPIPLP